MLSAITRTGITAAATASIAAAAILGGQALSQRAQHTVRGTNPAVVVEHTVRDFNDGFTTAKQDDCQQGAVVACEWLSATNPAAATAVAHHSLLPLPPGFHWVRASRSATRQECGRRRGLTAIEVWGGSGDTGVLVCSNGKAFTS
jgi:hypothetical protein